MKTSPLIPRQRAFSLIELLACISIIAILAVIISGAGKKIRGAADRVDAMACMRQLGTAVQSYANDNNGTLPGPLYSGQDPVYNVTKRNSLGYFLWSYMGAPEPNNKGQVLPALAPKAYSRACPQKNAVSVMVHQTVELDEIPYKPWGYPATSTDPESAPMKMARVVSAGLTKTWALTDVDKSLASPVNNTWYSALPDAPLYNPYRIRMFFDWHVEAIPVK